MGVGHPNEFFTAWRPYTLHGLADRLTAPLLVVFGEDDLANMPADLIMDTAEFAARLRRCDVQALARSGGGAPHCQMGATTAAAGAVMDWLDEEFGSTGHDGPPSGLTMADSVIDLIRVHHGTHAANRARDISKAR